MGWFKEKQKNGVVYRKVEKWSVIKKNIKNGFGKGECKLRGFFEISNVS